MTTNEYIELDKVYEDVEYCIFCEARDSLNVSSNLRQQIDKFKHNKEDLIKTLAMYTETMRERLNELEEIKTNLEMEEVTE